MGVKGVTPDWKLGVNSVKNSFMNRFMDRQCFCFISFQHSKV